MDKDLPFVKDLIDVDFYNRITVYGDHKKRKFPFELCFYKDVNIIFGDKGSGKSEIISSLKSYFENRNDRVIYYCGGDKGEWFDALLNANLSSLNTSLIDKSSFQNKFNEIRNFVDAIPIKPTTYYTYFKFLPNNKKSKTIKITEQNKFLSFELKKYNSLFEEANEISKFINKFREYEVSKKDPQLSIEIISKLKIAKQKSFELAISEWKNQYAKRLTDNAIDKINSFVSECIGGPEIPLNTGFYDFASKRIKINDILKDISSTLQYSKDLKNQYIGTIGTKGKGFLKEKIGFVNRNNIDNIEAKFLTKTKKSLKEFFDSFIS